MNGESTMFCFEWKNALWVVPAILLSCSGSSRQSIDRTLDGNDISDLIHIPNTLDQNNTMGVPEFTFQQATFDFDTIAQGDLVGHQFSFHNSGKAPLLISNVSSHCGCTTLTWPKHAIAIGDTSSILVQFDSDNRTGNQHRTILISANTSPPKTQIYLKGFVVPIDN